MRRGAVALLALLAWPASASASPVLVLGHDGRARLRNDPYLSGPALTPAPSVGGVAGRDRVQRPRLVLHTRRAAPQPTVRSQLSRLLHRHQINRVAYRRYTASFNAALAAERRLHGTRLDELTAVTVTLHEIAAAGGFIASRLPALFTTLDANRRWWTSGPLLSSGDRVELAGSQLVWEYYPGQGIQIQMLGSFGKANGLYEAGPAHYAAMQQLLGQLIGLAVQRAGGLAWEYYFAFDGGSPPWTSAMSQATGLQALSRAYLATHNGYYLRVATRALPLFSAPPPAGVRIATRLGARYLQYTFAPSVSIINAFLQTLIGLDTFAQTSGNALAARLFAAGNAEAEAELPFFDTGAWSLYQPGIEDDLSYHELVTGFLGQLCAMTGTPVYCTTAQHFRADLTTPPALTQLTTSTSTTAFDLRFRLSKFSHVGVILTRGSSVVFETSASFPYGVNAFAIPGLRAGSYGVRLAATDLAGNFGAINGTLKVSR